MKEQLQLLLDKYDPLPLECDGFSRVVSYVLTKAQIIHAIFIGTCQYNGVYVPVHYWIDVDDLRIDYRLRMWCGTTAPHGIFPIQDCPASYCGRQVSLTVPDFVFQILTEKS